MSNTDSSRNTTVEGKNRTQNNRTPSGSTINPQVQSIKNFFQRIENENEHGNAATSSPSSLRGVPHEQSQVEASANHANKHSELSEHDQSTDQGVKKKRKQISNPSSPEEKQECQSGKPKLFDNYTLIKPNCGSAITQKRYKMDTPHVEHDQMETVAEVIEEKITEIQATESLGVIDVRTVLDMFQSIKSEMAGRTEMTSNETIKQKIEEELNSAMSLQDTTIEKMKKEIQDLKRKSKLTEEVIQYNTCIISDLASKLDNVELNNTKRMAVLTGLQTPDKKKDYKEKVCDFMAENFQAYEVIEDVYKIGFKQPRPLVITFISSVEKEKIFQQKGKLKDLVVDKPIYLNHYITAAENEKRKRQRYIVSEMKKKDTTVEVEYTKDGLKVGSSVYRKQVESPKPSDLLQYSVQELDEILKVKTVRGPEISSKDSKFVAYIMDTNKIQTVRDAYFKIRLLNARARHIVCAYNIECADQQEHLFQDFCDDEEHGAGARLLAEMKKAGITQRAIFVARFCGKEKLKDDRIQCYVNAAYSLMAQKPLNSITKKNQNFEKQTPRQHEENEQPFNSTQNPRKYATRSHTPGVSKPMRGGKTTTQGGRGSYAKVASP